MPRNGSGKKNSRNGSSKHKKEKNYRKRDADESELFVKRIVNLLGPEKVTREPITTADKVPDFLITYPEDYRKRLPAEIEIESKVKPVIIEVKSNLTNLEHFNELVKKYHNAEFDTGKSEGLILFVHGRVNKQIIEKASATITKKEGPIIVVTHDMMKRALEKKKNSLIKEINEARKNSFNPKISEKKLTETIILLKDIEPIRQKALKKWREYRETGKRYPSSEKRRFFNGKGRAHFN